jgi:zinc protease
MSVQWVRAVGLAVVIGLSGALVPLQAQPAAVGQEAPVMPLGQGVFHPTTYTLANGMQVVVIENHRAPVVAHMVWYKVGAADDPPGKSGLAHYLEHMMFKGTAEMKPGEFSDIIARNGGDENAFTTYDYTAYFQTVAVEHLELMMRLEAQRMAAPSFPVEEAVPELEVVQQERKQRTEVNPGAKLSELSQASLFIHHPYGTPVIGWEHEIAGLTADDVRAFHQRWYAPNNAILVVHGDVQPEQVKLLAEKYYGVIPARPVPARVRPVEPPVFGERRVTFHDDRVTQPRVGRTYIAPSLHTTDNRAEIYALDVLSEIMGGGSVGRLYTALVVKNPVASSVGFYVDTDRLDMGTLGVQIVPAPGKTVAEAEAAMDAELAKLLDQGVTDQEVSDAQRRMMASAVYARDSVQGPAQTFGATLATEGTIADVEQWPDRISAVTAEQVTAAARAVLKLDRSVTSILLPAQDPHS